MDEVSACGGASAAGTLIHALDQEWTLSPKTKRMESQFCAWLALQARKGVWDGRELMSPEEYQDTLSAVNVDIATRKYAWGTEAWRRAISEKEGFSYMLHLLFKPKHGDITPEKAHSIFETDPQAVMGLFREAMGLTLPNGQAVKP